MSIEWFLYLISVLGNVSFLAHVLILICILCIIVGSFLSAMIWDTCQTEHFENFKIKRNKMVRVIIPLLFVSIALGTLIPSKTTMYAIGFSHYAKQTQIPQKLMDLLNQKIDDDLGGEKM